MEHTIENRLVWLNGDLTPVQDARLNVLTPTAQFGANVFEGIRCYWSEVDEQLYAFRLEEHYERLLASMSRMRMDTTYTVETMRQALLEVVRANDYREDIAVRQTVYLDGFGSWSATGPLGMWVAPIPKKRLLTNDLQGLTACVSPWIRISERNLSPKIKLGANYMNSRMALLDAREKGFDTAIFLNETGTVAEGVGSNLCMIVGNQLITPPDTASVLEGITRNTLLQLASELGMEVQMRDIDPLELQAASEVFLCGSAVELTPLVAIDGHRVGAGTTGPVTQKLHTTYLKLVSGELPAHRSWLTPVYG